MRPLYFLFGILIGLCAGGAAFLVGADLVIQAAVGEAAFAAALLIAISVGGFLSFFVTRHFFLKKFNIERNPSASVLVDQIFELSSKRNELEAQDRKNAAREIVKTAVAWITSSMGYYSLINAMVAVVAIFAGTAASLLLFKQNELISQQKKSDLLQAVLAESSRRALQFSFADLFIGELKRKELEASPPVNNLPGFRRTDAQVSEDIRTTLNRLQPYAIADFDPEKFSIERDVAESVSVSFLSPEKGQILRTLFEQNVNIGGSLGPANFSFADYRNYLSLTQIRELTCEDTGVEPDPDNALRSQFNRLEGITDIRNADFSNSVLTQVWFEFQTGVKAQGTVFQSSVVELDVIPKDQLILQKSILILKTSVDYSDLDVRMLGGCIWVIDDSQSKLLHPEAGRFWPGDRTSVLGLKLRIIEDGVRESFFRLSR